MNLLSNNNYDIRLERFKQIVQYYKINYDFAFRLRSIENFEIVLILDDSTSMLTPVIDQEYDKHSPFDRLPTRWDELQQMTSIIVDLAATLDPDGIDIYFLNRQPLLHVTDSSQLNETFSRPPNGPTPISRMLNYVLDLKRPFVNDRKLLILIATDGVPTDDKGQDDLVRLEKVLRECRYPSIERMFVTFIACTDDLKSVAYLNQFDKKIPFVDVLDDYHSERKEILAVQGKKFPFSYGDYVVKVLIGSVDQWFDKLDEKKVKLKASSSLPTASNSLGRTSSGQKKSCIIS